MMPSINKANPAMRLCAARHCLGCNCPHNASCKMIQKLDIAEWPDATFAKWSALVEQTPALVWNQKVVDPAKVSDCIAKLTATSLAGGTGSKDKL